MHDAMTIERPCHVTKNQGNREQSLPRYRRLASIVAQVCWLSLFLIFVAPVAVYAGDVYGRVIEKTGTFKPGDEITISGRDSSGNTISVIARTDKDGRYRLSLPPGNYQVEFTKGNQTFKGRVQSLPGASHQDIVLF